MDLEGIDGALTKKAQAGNRPAKSTTWAKKRFRQFGSKADFVRAQPCIAASFVAAFGGDECAGRIEACHGVARSHDPNSNVLFAACTLHHEMSDGRRRCPDDGVGRTAFERYFGVSIVAACARVEAEWPAWCARHGIDPDKPADRGRAKGEIDGAANLKAHAHGEGEIAATAAEEVGAVIASLEGTKSRRLHEALKHLRHARHALTARRVDEGRKP